ncbi:MAG: tripartite tricarboxylate transporter TctB family protein [Gammaproteobacteria bacterium]|nr:tripartite tricarboxylate transporter TctB family protein [Gammaproteobacteria bacterium]
MRERRNRMLAELVLPVLAIVFTSYYIESVLDGPWEAKFSAYLVGFSLIVVSLVFVVSRVLAILRDTPAVPAAPRSLSRAQGGDRSVLLRRLALLVLTLAYILLIQNGGGFTLSNFAFLSIAIVLLSGGARPLRAVLVAALLSLSGYLIFIVAFHTRFPEGPFERMMDMLLR